MRGCIPSCRITHLKWLTNRAKTYSYTQLYFTQNASVTPRAPSPNRDRTKRIPDEHSTLVPPLPIPNRAVKRCCADDSMDCPCESRSSSGPEKTKSPGHQSGLFASVAPVADELLAPRRNIGQFY